MVFGFGPDCFFYSRLGYIDIPDAFNDQYSSCRERKLTIYLSKEGKVSLNGDIIDNMNALPMHVGDTLEEMKAGTKATLVADRYVSFCMVQEVLRAAKRGGVTDVDLLTSYSESVWTHMSR
jgi:biopolymer transport protein ExbD